MKGKIIITLTFVFSLIVCGAFKNDAHKDEQTVREFYSLLNEKNADNAKKIAARIFAEGWKSYANNEDYREGGRSALLNLIAASHKEVPDLKWEIKEIIKSGNRYTVRSEVTGTPSGEFMGIKTNGHSFKIMTIDIHTVKNGELADCYHLEDWNSAIQQVSIK